MSYTDENVLVWRHHRKFSIGIRSTDIYWDGHDAYKTVHRMMAKQKALYSEGGVTVEQVERNNKNRGKFRHLAREVSREVFDVPDDNLMLFIYKRQHPHTFLVGQTCFCLADLTIREPSVNFDSEYFSQLTFMFIHRDYQDKGYGTILLNEVLKIMRSHDTNRPIRLQSANDAVLFFEKFGFRVIGEPIECFHAGCRLFRTIVNMELKPT